MKTFITIATLLLATNPGFAQMKQVQQVKRSPESVRAELAWDAYFGLATAVSAAERIIGTNVMWDIVHTPDQSPLVQKVAYEKAQSMRRWGAVGMMAFPMAMVATHYGLKVLDEQVQQRAEQVKQQRAALGAAR